MYAVPHLITASNNITSISTITMVIVPRTPMITMPEAEVIKVLPVGVSLSFGVMVPRSYTPNVVAGQHVVETTV